jgi:hypothetical protein
VSKKQNPSALPLPTSSSVNRTHWPKIWEEAVEKNRDALVGRATKQLRSIRSSEKRFQALALYRSYYKDELKRLPLYKKQKKLPRGADRQQALLSQTQEEFFNWIELGSYTRAIFELRTLQFELLGLYEAPSPFATEEEERARVARIAKHKAQHSPRSVRKTGDTPFEKTFVEGIKVLDLLKILEKNNIITATGQWADGSNRKSALLALIRILQEKEYLLGLSRAELARAFSKQFSLNLSRSYSQREPGEKQLERFSKIVPNRQ